MNYIRNHIYNPFSSKINHGTHPFKLGMSLDRRQTLYERLMIEYANKIPIIIHHPSIDPLKSKLLADESTTIEQTVAKIKRYILTDKNISLQVQDGTTLELDAIIGKAYSKYKDPEDNMLYLWIIFD